MSGKNGETGPDVAREQADGVNHVPQTLSEAMELVEGRQEAVNQALEHTKGVVQPLIDDMFDGVLREPEVLKVESSSEGFSVLVTAKGYITDEELHKICTKLGYSYSENTYRPIGKELIGNTSKIELSIPVN